MDSLLKLKNVNLKYQTGNDTIKVLKNVNLETKKNESISIVGESGSGKTSLIMLAGGLEKATSGKIFFEDQEISKMSEDEVSKIRRKNIGIVFQSFYLIPNLTAIENVLLSLEANQKYNQDDDAKALLADFGLYHRLNHLPSELSGGEQQRVAIARALINKPKIILADEPTGNLDSANSESMMDLLFNYTKKSKTSLVMVTHDNSIAERCDRIIEIKDGQIV